MLTKKVNSKKTISVRLKNTLKKRSEKQENTAIDKIDLPK